MNTFKVAKWNIAFAVGEIYQNYLGDYCVTNINDDGKVMSVEYRSGDRMGTQQALEILGQAKVIHNARVRELQAMKMRKIQCNIYS